MAIALSIFGVIFAAVCVWLGVRIFNRREKWAKRTAVGLTATVLIGYPLSIGPACWIVTQKDDASRLKMFDAIYRPLLSVIIEVPPAIEAPLEWYLGLFAPAESKPIFWKDDSPNHFGIGWEYPKESAYYTALSRRRSVPRAPVKSPASNPDGPSKSN